MKKNEFENWMVKQKPRKLKPATAAQYANAIDDISKHYSQQANEKVDLYNNPGIVFAKKLVSAYGKGGKYEDFGQKGPRGNGKGTVCAAIAAYSGFLSYKNGNGGNNGENGEEPGNEDITKNFTGEEN